MMPPEQKPSCPIGPAPLNAGGQIDASVGENLGQKMRITFTPTFGQGDPDEACALIGLVKIPKHAVDAYVLYEFNVLHRTI